MAGLRGTGRPSERASRQVRGFWVLDWGYERPGAGTDRGGVATGGDRRGGAGCRQRIATRATAGGFHVAGGAHDGVFPAGDFDSDQRGADPGVVVPGPDEVGRSRNGSEKSRTEASEPEGSRKLEGPALRRTAEPWGVSLLGLAIAGARESNPEPFQPPDPEGR